MLRPESVHDSIRSHVHGLERAVRRWIDEDPAPDHRDERPRLQLHRELTALTVRVETLLALSQGDLPGGPRVANIPRP